MFRFLAVMLFHNDEHLVEEQIEHMLSNDHDIIIFNHNSCDRTQELIDTAKDKHERVRETYEFDSSIGFANGEIFARISDILMETYKDSYDWISFIESDEFLEGPSRDKTYGEYLRDVASTDATYVQFNNMNYWFTSKDDASIKRVRDRVRHYAWFYNCGPRIYAWKAEYTNRREWNHNLPSTAIKHPTNFNTCHYPYVSKEHYLHKLETRKLASREDGTNYHYKKLAGDADKILSLKMEDMLLYDEGKDLEVTKHYDWKQDVY